ncbi:MAG: DNA/RNA non-specific endonuclease [Flavobacteriales bacterium]|nr:DNA/RNA non-specific endonuclease [Flavobacteriales bacterium]MCB9166696.1 DNA/RNA non-specific endonuclease [Flavobacteriales bacterium]
MSTLRTVPLLLLLTPFCIRAQEDADAHLHKLEAELEALRAQEAPLESGIEQAKLAVMQRDLRRWGYPALASSDVVVEHPGHALVYDARDQVPKWTAHIVTPDVVTGNLARIDTFLPDPQVPVNTDMFNDYWYSGYDRGHMVPSADMRWSLDAMKATYYYSNISPQKPELNRGAWADLEDWVRRTVRYGNERVFVVTGPVLKDGLPELHTPNGTHHIRIPELFFKVVADIDGPEKKGIAFLMTNGVNEDPVISYAVPIDSVEELTGLDFFPALDDTLEARIEAQRDPMAWYHNGDPFQGEAEPMHPPLPRGMFNTVQAKYHVGNTATICGTVVSTRRTAKANAIYLNLDRMHPHQDFYATVWDYNGPNFSYDPETYLLHRKVCITGKVTIYDDIPRISVNNEEEIRFWEEVLK